MRKKLRKDSEDVPFAQTLYSVRKYPGHLPYLINFATKKSSKTPIKAQAVYFPLPAMLITLLTSAIFIFYHKRSQGPRNHLRWRALQQLLTIKRR